MPVNFAVGVATGEGPVFFCSDACIPKYEAKPGKYAARVAVQRSALANRPKVQVLCPVSREPADSKTFVEHGGERVYLCCKGCIRKFKRSPAQYAAALANSYTHQTKCPVMGGEIDPQVFASTAGGQKVFFCCEGCENKLFADPSKYLPNLEAQGFQINPGQMKHAEPDVQGGSPGRSPQEQGHAGHEHGT
ncbi:MAG: hypothetical protein ACYSVY_15325 [Planctomycetota bacterium]|jgi:YHS domain-containing protein